MSPKKEKQAPAFLDTSNVLPLFAGLIGVGRLGMVEDFAQVKEVLLGRAR
jgi:hypothetical protein